MKMLSLIKGKRKLVLLLAILLLGLILGMKLNQLQAPQETVETTAMLERSLIKKFSIPFMQAKPGSESVSFTIPLPNIETLTLSNNGRNIALWLQPFRWVGKFCLINIKGEEEVSKEFDDFSLELIFPGFFLEAGDPTHISWSPDDSELVFSVRKVSPPETEEEEKTFKKWLTVIYNRSGKSFKLMKGYSTVNIVNPWGTDWDKGILLKKEEGEKIFSLVVVSPSSGEILWSLTPKNFQIRADEVIARDKNKIYVFEQEIKDGTRIWEIDFQNNKEEKIHLDLRLDKGYRYYSIPSTDLEYFALIGVPKKYPEKLSGPKTFFEIRELSTGNLIKKLGFKDYYLHFFRWSPDANKVAFLKFNRNSGLLGIWDFKKNKLYELPAGQREVLAVGFTNQSDSLYVFSRENVKECSIYVVKIPR